MVPQLESSIARIRKDSSVIGAGVLVNEHIVLTCAHVIKNTVGQMDSPIGKQVYLDFPLMAREKILKASVIFFDAQHDIAGLKVIDELPNGVQSSNQSLQSELWGHPFEAFGFPQGYDEGIWVSGVCRRADSRGWLQIEDIKEPGYNIESGFSGTPVWDEDQKAVVGIVVAAERQKEKKSAFAIPIGMILETWPQLKTILNLDDPLKVIKGELKSMAQIEKNKPFVPLIEELKTLIRFGDYELEIINETINIINKLVDIRDDDNFHEIFEKVSLGLIPSDWAIETSLSGCKYDDLIKCVIGLFEGHRDRLAKELGLKIRVPIVLVVMNKKEASDLNSGIVFDESTTKLKEDFERFKSRLVERGLAEWPKSYWDSPNNWQPFLDNKKTIEKLLLKALYDLKRGDTTPVFIDIHTLNKECYRQTLRILREKGCVIIMDVISMQHPIIQQEFRRTSIDAFSCNLIAKVAPNADALDFVKQMAIIFELHADMEFYKRCNIDKDHKCKQVSNENEFMVWFGDHAKDLPVFSVAKSSSIHNQFFKET